MARAATLLKDDDDDNATVDTAVDIDLPNGLSGDGPRVTRTAEEVGQDYSIVETDDTYKPLSGPGSDQREELRTDEETHTAETPETTRERLTKAQRRAIQRTARERSQNELQQYRDEVTRLRTENDEFRRAVTPRLDQIDESRYRDQLTSVDRQIADAASSVDGAIQRMSAAISTGDAEAHEKALRDHTKAVTRGYELASHKATLEATRAQVSQPTEQRQQPQQQQVQQPRAQQDPVVAERVKEFSANYPWLNLQTPNRDTRFALVIDEEVARDGFDPRDDDYWDELDARLREAMPDKFQAQPRQAAQPRRAAQARAQTPTERRGPMVAGSGGNAGSDGPRKVLLSPERKQAMIQAGVLEADGRTIADRKRFNSLAARYDAYDRENNVAAAR